MVKAVIAEERVEGDWRSTGGAATFEFAGLVCFFVLVNVSQAERTALCFLDRVCGRGIEGGPAMGTGSVSGIDLSPALRAEQGQFRATGCTLGVALAHCRATVRAEGLAASGAFGCAGRYCGTTTGAGHTCLEPAA
jgi:hypothetical protein